MTYSIIADYFLALGNTTGEVITNLKLQKLVYYTQAWHLAIFGKPIFKDDFEAWVHGPVLPALYQDYKEYRWRPIDREDLDEEKFNELRASFDPDLAELLDEVVAEYFSLSGYELEQLTHAEEPWLMARGGCPADAICHHPIDKKWMQNYYKKRLEN